MISLGQNCISVGFSEPGIPTWNEAHIRERGRDSTRPVQTQAPVTYPCRLQMAQRRSETAICPPGSRDLRASMVPRFLRESQRTAGMECWGSRRLVPRPRISEQVQPALFFKACVPRAPGHCRQQGSSTLTWCRPRVNCFQTLAVKAPRTVDELRRCSRWSKAAISRDRHQGVSRRLAQSCRQGPGPSFVRKRCSQRKRRGGSWGVSGPGFQELLPRSVALLRPCRKGSQITGSSLFFFAPEDHHWSFQVRHSTRFGFEANFCTSFPFHFCSPGSAHIGSEQLYSGTNL